MISLTDSHDNKVILSHWWDIVSFVKVFLMFPIKLDSGMNSRSDYKTWFGFKIVSFSKNVASIEGLLILAVSFDTAEGEMAHWKSLCDGFFCWQFHFFLV